MSTRRVAALLVAAMGFAGWGYSQSLPQERYEISARQVALAISSKGIQVAGVQVSLLAKVVASEPDPVLDVLSVEHRGGRRAAEHTGGIYLVKLGCHSEPACLPFYASVNTTEESSAPATGVSIGMLASRNAALKTDAAITMRAGTHATLIMDDGRAQIEVAVISLESGTAGHRIHVASPDHKQVYLAEVVSATLLTRSF
jgi:hypothetical protein